MEAGGKEQETLSNLPASVIAPHEKPGSTLLLK
jgi:hypothetical protein